MSKGGHLLPNQKASARGRIVRRHQLAAAAIAVAMLCAACGDSGSGSGSTATTTTAASGGSKSASAILGPEKKATGEPVQIGFITDGKNSVTDQSIDLDVAAATVKYANEHRGGIAGRPIELTTCESQLDPAKATDCANRMVEDKVDAVVVGTTGEVEPIWTVLQAAAIPTMWYAAQGDKVLADTQSTFSLADPSASTVGLPISVAKEHKKKKVTVIVIDVPPAIAAYEGAGAKRFKDAGIELNLLRVPPGTADMTAQLQTALGGDPGVVHVLGNDAFCIAAFQGLQTLGFKGPRTTITPCITDATRKAVPGDVLKGIVVSASSPVDANNEMDELYRTVMSTYGSGIDTSRASGHGTFTAMLGLVTALEGLTGEVTPATITAAIKAMPQKDLPDGGGLTYQCDGKRLPESPAVCVKGTLVTTLDDQGLPTSYKLATS
jgi:ABC-type branched-subunit amino acid transport system substrate-binding protein